MNAHEQTTDRFLREPEVRSIIGLSRTTRWRLEREGKFPNRKALSKNSVGWLESDIQAWINGRLKATAAA